jgi:hypothetical protein
MEILLSPEGSESSFRDRCFRLQCGKFSQESSKFAEGNEIFDSFTHDEAAQAANYYSGS